MKSIKLSMDAKEALVGKTIIFCGDDFIKLDNGCMIYIGEDEIHMLGSVNTNEETLNDK